MSDFDWNAHPVVGAPETQQAPASGGFDWNAHPVVPEEQSPGVLQSILNGAVKVGKGIDSVTGAPTRAAISAAQNGNDPVSAFASQFAGDTDKAPTPKEIVMKAGLSDKHYDGMTAEQQKAFDDQNNLTNAGIPSKPLSAYKDIKTWSPADVGGVAMGVAADPSLLIPVVGESKFGAKILKGAGETIGKGGEALNGLAEKFAVNATGATGKQASKFADNAGRELLDRGIVQFGDSQSKIADRASAAVEGANSQIDAALGKLEAQGVKIDTNQVKRNLVEKVRDLAGDPSEHDVLKLINNEIQNITDAAQARGTTDQGILAAEKTKRGYSKIAKDWTNPKSGQAGKEAYLTQMQAVEDAATAADPETAKLFKEGKASYGLLSPIQEAAERRAMTTGQHQAGGLLDMAASVAGEGALGPVGAIATPVARRVISPRITSSMAVGADKLGDLLKGVPELKNIQTENPVLYQALLSHLAGPTERALKVADQPARGETKWANDGHDNLLEHAGDDQATKDLIEKAKANLSADPGTKKLFIEASDLKPKSKAMGRVVDKIKAKLASGDE